MALAVSCLVAVLLNLQVVILVVKSVRPTHVTYTEEYSERKRVMSRPDCFLLQLL